MNPAVAFHRAARIEFLAAAARYETQRPNLGTAFIAEIDRCIDEAASAPQRYALIHHQLRRVVARRFPYSVYFRMEHDRIVVLAVFHGRRNPAIWQGRR